MKKLGQKIDVQTSHSIISVCVALLTLSACFVPRTEGDQIQTDIAKLRGELVTTQRDQGDLLGLLDARIKRLEEGSYKQNADTSLEKDKLNTQIEQLKSQLEEIKQAPVVANVTSAPEGISKTDLIAALKTLFADKEYERTISGCDSFLGKYPDDKQFAAQVLYWRGSSYYEVGEYKKAVLSYQELLTKYQNFSKVPEVLYKVGLSLESLKFPKDAAVFFEEVVSKHPKSTFVAKAKEQLNKKKKK